MLAEGSDPRGQRGIDQRQRIFVAKQRNRIVRHMKPFDLGLSRHPEHSGRKNPRRERDEGADAIQFLGRTAWPIVDLIVRFWIAKPAIVSGLLLANDWNTALMLAISEYPVSWLDPRTEALLGIILASC